MRSLTFTRNHKIILTLGTSAALIAILISSLFLTSHASSHKQVRGEQSTTTTGATTTIQLNEEIEAVETTTTTTTLPAVRDYITDEIFATTTTTSPPAGIAVTPASSPPAPPTNFVPDGYIKKSSYWLVLFAWTPSTTPDVSYCIYRDVDDSDDCVFNELYMIPADSVELAVGERRFINYFLVAVNRAGQKSSTTTVSYSLGI